MAFFGLFGKKKEKKEVKEMPKAPVPPSLSKAEEKAVKPPQHVDDLGSGFGMGAEGLKMPEGLELPELEFPKLEIPPLEEKEIRKAVEEKARPVKIEIKPKKAPARLPDIEKVPEPKKPEFEFATIEEPIELKPTPHVKGPVFIRSDQFKVIKANINGLRESLGKAEETLNNVTEIKNREDSEYEAWHSAAEAIQRKLLYIDKMLFE